MRVKKSKAGKFFIVLFLFSILAVPLSVTAQSNEIIDQVIEQGELIYENGAYFVLTASGIIPDSAAPDEAYSAILEKQDDWKLKNLSPKKKMRVGDFSYILMRALEIKGGLLYRIFPGPRYAARELAYLGIIKENGGPYRTISGSEAIQILGDTLEWKEARK